LRALKDVLCSANSSASPSTDRLVHALEGRGFVGAHRRRGSAGHEAFEEIHGRMPGMAPYHDLLRGPSGTRREASRLSWRSSGILDIMRRERLRRFARSCRLRVRSSGRIDGVQSVCRVPGTCDATASILPVENMFLPLCGCGVVVLEGRRPPSRYLHRVKAQGPQRTRNAIATSNAEIGTTACIC
jgi:hypothetical protein